MHFWMRPTFLLTALLAGLFATLALAAPTGSSTVKKATPAATQSQPAPAQSLAPVPRAKEQSSHAPFLAGDCIACHQRNDRKKPGKVRVASPELCLGCHEQAGEMENHKELVTTSCVECHNPHNAVDKHLLH